MPSSHSYLLSISPVLPVIMYRCMRHLHNIPIIKEYDGVLQHNGSVAGKELDLCQ